MPDLEKRSLSELAPGESAKVAATPTANERLAEIGFVKGEAVTLVKKAPLGDPLVFKILDAEIVLRRSDAEEVVIY